MSSIRHLGLFPLKCGGGPINSPYQKFTLDKKQAVALCWRIKKWKYDFSITQTGDIWYADFTNNQWINGTDLSITFASSGEFLAGTSYKASHIDVANVGKPSGPATDEKDLICATSVEYGSSAMRLTTSTMTATMSGFGTSHNFAMRVLLRRIPYRVDNDTYEFGFHYIEDLLPFPFFNLSTGDKDLTGTLSFLGNNFTVMFSSGDFGGTSMSYPTTPVDGPFGYSYRHTTNFVFTMEPAEYWPYDPLDGQGPIYDSVSGQKLREFPTD